MKQLCNTHLKYNIGKKSKHGFLLYSELNSSLQYPVAGITKYL